MDLFSFAAWTHLQLPPSDLDKPLRFSSWAKGESRGIRSGPQEELCINADGSFKPESKQAGWGAVLLKQRSRIQIKKAV